MSERFNLSPKLEELINKATYTNYATDGQKVIFLSKKEFAESIVRECAKICNDNQFQPAANMILDYFGIEQ